eukprot:1393784-Amorphochlora_amoeboformis.AAC.2
MRRIETNQESDKGWEHPRPVSRRPPRPHPAFKMILGELPKFYIIFSADKRSRKDLMNRDRRGTARKNARKSAPKRGIFDKRSQSRVCVRGEGLLRSKRFKGSSILAKQKGFRPDTFDGKAHFLKVRKRFRDKVFSLMRRNGLEFQLRKALRNGKEEEGYRFTSESNLVSNTRWVQDSPELSDPHDLPLVDYRHNWKGHQNPRREQAQPSGSFFSPFHSAYPTKPLKSQESPLASPSVSSYPGYRLWGQQDSWRSQEPSFACKRMPINPGWKGEEILSPPGPEKILSPIRFSPELEVRGSWAPVQAVGESGETTRETREMPEPMGSWDRKRSLKGSCNMEAGSQLLLYSPPEYVEYKEGTDEHQGRFLQRRERRSAGFHFVTNVPYAESHSPLDPQSRNYSHRQRFIFGLHGIRASQEHYWAGSDRNRYSRQQDLQQHLRHGR